MYDQAVAAGFQYPDSLDVWLAPPWTVYEAHRNAVTPWQDQAVVQHVYDFEAVLHARWPSVSDQGLHPWHRKALRLLSEARWRNQRYGRPIEIKALQKLWQHRPRRRWGSDGARWHLLHQ